MEVEIPIIVADRDRLEAFHACFPDRDQCVTRPSERRKPGDVWPQFRAVNADLANDLKSGR